MAVNNRLKKLISRDPEIIWVNISTDKTGDENLNQDINKRKLGEKGREFCKCEIMTEYSS